ncbi:MAG: hypothetical protein Q9169_003517 [Polycauliona sp. 2 TL-2023]
MESGLTCKLFAAVGIDYLSSTIHLIFTRKSFDRLADIAGHPTFRHHVKSLIYCIDALPQYPNRHDWMERVQDVTRTSGDGLELLPREAADLFEPSWREWRMFFCNKDMWPFPRWRNDKEQLSVSYGNYINLWHQQDRLRQDNFAESELQEILPQLPNLKHVTISNFHEMYSSQSLHNLSLDTIVETDGDERYGNHCGVPQLLSLCRAIDSADANTKLETLKIGILSWKALQESTSNTALTKRALRGLRVLQMVLCASQEYIIQDKDNDFERQEADDLECQAFLDTGHHLELLRAMPDLQSLDLYI